MIEALKHMLGICGEHWHPNIFSILIGGTGFTLAFQSIRFKVRSFFKKEKNGAS